MNIQNTAYSSIRQNCESTDSGDDSESDCSRFTVRRNNKSVHFGCLRVSPKAISKKVERPESPLSQRAFCWDYETVEGSSESPPPIGPLDDPSVGALRCVIGVDMDP